MYASDLAERMFRTGRWIRCKLWEGKDQFPGYFQPANGAPVLPKILYGGPLLTVGASNVHSRRLEDHIRDLCAQIIAAPESELEPVLSELKSALHEHSIKLRKLAAEKLTGVEPSPSDRRKEE